MKRRAFLLACASGLAACATAPKEETRTRPFASADFFALDPAVLRAAVLTEPQVVLQSVQIEVLLAQERFVFRLQQRAAPDPRLSPPADGLGWQVFSLGAEDAATLATVRQMLLARPQESRQAVQTSVAARPALVPAELLAALPLRIDMLVDNREGWFTHLPLQARDLRPEAPPAR